jgi:ribosomal protein S18 acetylase RimI-like enzyme
MPNDLSQVEYRMAGYSDARAIALLHSDSWRRHYRGAYSDAYLDGDVASDRLAVWSDRLKAPGRRRLTVVAEDAGVIVGFAHTILDEDQTWGALLDNLHVADAVKRRGIGSALMVATAHLVIEQAPTQGLYLWVLEQNTGARAFYDAMGGQHVGSGVVPPPGGHPSRLDGTPVMLRYSWLDPSGLLGRAGRPEYRTG